MNKDVKGKFVKNLDKKCPDCETSNLQIRSYKGYSIIICSVCGYEHDDEAKNKKSLAESRRVKNEELEVREKQNRTSSPNNKRDERSFKQNRGRNAFGTQKANR